MSHDLCGRLLCLNGDVLGRRYRVIEDCSSGGFSNVYICRDIRIRRDVIIKVYKAQHYYRDAALREVAIMRALNKLDPCEEHFIRCFGSFKHNGHVCVVFERFGPTLFDAFEMRGFKPLNSFALRSIMNQLCNALKVLHENGIIHTDLKLENILLPVGFDALKCFDLQPPNSDAPSDCGSGYEEISISVMDHKGGDRGEIENERPGIDIRLIDFGSFAKSDKWHRNLATTRQYRAPEILMGAQWGIECDIWSLGCILVELATGSIEFDSKNDLEHLFLIQHMISPMPENMCRNTSIQQIRNALCGNLINPNVFDEETKNNMMAKPTLYELLKFDEDLCDIALKMLNTDPLKRPTVNQILEHNFFKNFNVY